MKLRGTILAAVCVSLLASYWAWAQDHASLDIQISLSSSTVLLGEPAWVDVRITNRSNEVLLIDTGHRCAGNKPLIKVQVPAAEHGSGERTSCKLYSGLLGSCPFTPPPLVAPGQTIVRRYVLSGDFRITHPGSYSVLLEKEINYSPAPPADVPWYTPEPGEKQTANSQVTLDVLPGDPEKLLVREKELARKASEPVPEAALPAVPQGQPLDEEAGRVREIQGNAYMDAILMRDVIPEGLAAYPIAGMEPVFSKWAEKTNSYYGLAGLKRLNTAAAREALAAIAASTERPGDSFFQSTRSQAVDALADMGDPSYLPLLEKLTRESHRNVRDSAIGALGLLGGEQELSHLTTLAVHGLTSSERSAAINAIGDSHSLKAVPVLIDLAAAPDLWQPSDSYYSLLTLTHLQFPAPDHRPVAEVQRAWMEFWRSQEPGARAYSRYDCPNPVELGVFK
jgi:HEAT repeats